MNKSVYDVIIIGGSYAGLSAAMALGRSLRHVLVIDSGKPCNRTTPHSHNFITQDGETPAAIARKAKEQVLRYSTIHFVNDTAIAGSATGNGFVISTEAGKTFEAHKLIFATGIKDGMPNIRGFAECWGITAVHCPYCHGYELRNKKTGILANGDRAFHLAGLVHNLANDLTILTSGIADFTAEQRRTLNHYGIKIVESAADRIMHVDGAIEAIHFTDGSELKVEALYAALPFTQHSGVPALLGCQLTEQGHIKVDAFQQTTVPGVYACGDSAAMMRSLSSAVYSGNLAGAMVNKALVDERF